MGLLPGIEVVEGQAEKGRFRYLKTITSSWLVLFSVNLLCVLGARGQSTVFHLRSGDRIAGLVIRESTNSVTVSNAWTKALEIPLAEISRRESTVTNPPPVAVNPIPVPVQKTTNAPGPAKLDLAKPVTPPVTNTFWSHVKGEVSLGADLIFGASDRRIYFGNAKLNYTEPYKSDPKQFFREALSFSGEYGKTDGIISANRVDGSSKTDFDLSRKFYLYNLAGVGYDEVRLIDLSYEEGPGAGIHLYNTTNLVVNAELGANYQVQDRSDGTFTDDFYYRISENIVWKLNKGFSISEKLELFPRADEWGQYRSRFETTLSYSFMTHLTLNFTAIDQYDTRPAAGVSKNEFQLRTTLGVKF